MGNCVRREVGFEVEDETNAPPAPEIIDKIVLMKKKTKRKQKIEEDENLNNIEINDVKPEKPVEKKKVKGKRPPREVMPEPIKEEPPKIEEPPKEEPKYEEPVIEEPPKEEIIEDQPRKSRRIYLGDYVSNDKSQQMIIRDGVNVREDNLNLFI